jgi:single-stranded-DNA-specific exonuclease
MANDGEVLSPPNLQLSWVIRPCQEEAVVRLVHGLAISPWTARILASRGIEDPLEAQALLKPETQPYHDPYPLPGLDTFLQRIEQAIRNRDRVIIHGDYDADGITSAAILQFALQRVGLDPQVFLPNRFEGGYGIQPEWIAAQKEAGFKLIITTDCGSSAEEACRCAGEVGIDLIITDHHTPNPALPHVIAHVNPHLPGCQYPFKDLCGAGVAFKLAQALTSFVPPSFQAQYRREIPIDLAMIGTLADVMPLRGENRRIVVDGLDRVRSSPGVGLQALLTAARCSPAGVNAETIAYQVGPRLNAAGRLRSPQLAFDLLTAVSPERAQALAKDLEKANDERKRLASKATEAAIERLRGESHDGAVIMADADWHRGILGILAAKVMEATGLPTFVASIEGEMVHGSARVPPGYNAARILELVSELTERGGGHSAAAGFTVRTEAWEEFEQAVRDAIRDHALEIAGPEIPVDAFLDGASGISEILREVSCLDPYGPGFPVPALAICRFEGKGRGSIFGDGHLKVNLGSPQAPLEAVGFSMGEWAKDLERGPVDLAIEYGENHWNGKTVLRPKILGIRPCLREDTRSCRIEEVSRFDGGEGLGQLILWDSRGLPPLETNSCLRIGYGPDWRSWWNQTLPGTQNYWKIRAWDKFAALPSGSWPGGCSTGYGGEIPEEWDGRVVEILFPPLRKVDRIWLRSVLTSGGGESLLRLAYSPDEIREWCAAGEVETGREVLATVYRGLAPETSLRDLFQLPLKPAALGCALEVLSDLELIRIQGEMIRKVSDPVKRDLSESQFPAAWEKHRRSIVAWVEQVTTRNATELLRRWLQDG